LSLSKLPANQSKGSGTGAVLLKRTVMKDIYWIVDSRSFKLLTNQDDTSLIEPPVPQSFLGRVASCFIQTSPASNHEMVVTVFPPRPFNVWFDFYGAKVSF
jgi:hypothetical protein